MEALHDASKTHRNQTTPKIITYRSLLSDTQLLV